MSASFPYPAAVRPKDLQPIGEELAIQWEDGSESYLRLDTLRRSCPCAECQGERDVLGQLHRGPARPLTPASYQLRELRPVGSYAVQPVWADGHNTGLFTFDYLFRLAHSPPTA
ncbi:MAG: DUF971 domain-containing protein [Verrucomicrobiales bacterium]|nr:DUF971 domain-containing protein [Verrucomicrobiales bacterium]